jgi:DNA-binding protein YbaB
MRAEMKKSRVEESLQGIQVSGNANLEIDKIDIDAALLHPDRKEELEDLLIACYTSWKSKAEKMSEEVSARVVDQMLPPGMDDLFKNFK